MHYRADVSEPDPSPIIISNYLSEPGPTRRVPTGSDGLGSGIYPLIHTYILQICIHHPMTPIPLRTPSVTGGSVITAIMAAGPDGCLFALAYLHPPSPLPVASLEFCHVVKCMCLCAEVFFSCSHTVLL